MAFILIDRRKAGQGKSSENRQKLIKRIKSFIKSSVPQNIGQGGVSGTKAKSDSPVKVAGTALEEPWFAYANDGQQTAVIIGNTEYQRGDKVRIPEDDEGGAGGKGGPGENGEDEFIVNIARGEFLDLFFEDCELPNLVNEKFTDKADNTFQPAGFSTTGNPAQLSVIRTYKQSLGRRKALQGPYKTEKEALELELRMLEERIPGTEYIAAEQLKVRVAEIYVRLAELDKKIAFIAGFDKSDLRYRKKEAKPLKTVDSVLFFLMDISGSMDEEKKIIARRWFALLYAFIQRRYATTELVFIAHTTEAFEMSEEDFFSTRMNGGTSVSPALEMVDNIIKERYDPNETNIYVCHASDGDNWDDDNDLVVDRLTGDHPLLDKVNLFSYIEVGQARGGSRDTNLWEAYDYVRENVRSGKVTLSIVETAEECYPVFKTLFKRKR
jgi:hypothetical protein